MLLPIRLIRLLNSFFYFWIKRLSVKQRQRISRKKREMKTERMSLKREKERVKRKKMMRKI